MREGDPHRPSCRRSTLVLPFSLQQISRRGAPQKLTAVWFVASKAASHPGPASFFFRGGPRAASSHRSANVILHRQRTWGRVLTRLCRLWTDCPCSHGLGPIRATVCKCTARCCVPVVIDGMHLSAPPASALRQDCVARMRRDRQAMPLLGGGAVSRRQASGSGDRTGGLPGGTCVRRTQRSL
jgi:hypothetical protein